MAGWAAWILGIALTTAWFAGMVFSDRWYWSQWLLWMTGLSLIPSGGLLLIAHWLLTQRVRIYAIGLVLLGPALWAFGLIGTHQINPNRTSDSIRILQWSAGPVIGKPEDFATFIVNNNADVSIVHGGHRAASSEAYRAWTHDRQVTIRGAFLISSRLPIHRLQTLIWADNITLVLLELHPPDAAPIRMVLADLPSSPQRSRSQVAQRVHEVLADLSGTIDIILGDFNMTNDSWQLRHLTDNLHPMWSHCGFGWGGTYPRWLPIVQLDHVLSTPDRVQSMHVIAPAVGRHRAIVTEYVLKPAD